MIAKNCKTKQYKEEIIISDKEKTRNDLLVIDRDKGFCNELSNLLKKEAKFDEVSMVHNGQTGLKRIVKEKPDYLIMDLILPKLDGMSILDELKEEELIRDTKIVIVTSFLNNQMFKILRKYDVDYFMIKPVKVKYVIKRIKDLSLKYSYNDKSDFVKEGVVNNQEGNKLNLKITKLLDEFGIPANIRGYLYLRKAIFLSFKNQGLITSITKKLYPKIATMFSTKPSRVERAIRHAIKVAWERGNQEKIDQYFGYCISETIGRPTNAQFIAKVSDNFRLQNGMITN